MIVFLLRSYVKINFKQSGSRGDPKIAPAGNTRVKLRN
jgi:hypothetical protein